MPGTNGFSDILRRAGPYLNIGTTFLAALALFIWLGHKADGWLETRPWLTLAGLLTGFAIGTSNLIQTIRRRPPP